MSGIKRFLDSLIDLERSTGILDDRLKAWHNEPPLNKISVLTARNVNGTLVIKEGNVEDVDIKETNKQKAERKRQNDSVLRSYGLYKEPKAQGGQVVKSTQDFIFIYYVDFKIKACYAKYREPKAWR